MNTKSTQNSSRIISFLISLLRIVLTVAVLLYVVRPFIPLVEELIPVALRTYGLAGEDIKIAVRIYVPDISQRRRIDRYSQGQRNRCVFVMKRFPSGIILFGKHFLI